MFTCIPITYLYINILPILVSFISITNGNHICINIKIGIRFLKRNSYIGVLQSLCVNSFELCIKIHCKGGFW